MNAKGQGRPRKPTALRIAEGNPGKRALPKKEPRPKSRIPKPRAGMSEGGRVVWDRVIPLLAEMDILAGIDSESFSDFCELQAECIELFRRLPALRAEGKELDEYLYTARLANNLRLSSFRYLTEFGMTPASRTRVQTIGDGDDKPKDDSVEGFRVATFDVDPPTVEAAAS